MLKIEHIKGRDLVEALNNAEDLIPDHYDEMYGCEFFYESQLVKDDMFILSFSIENGYYIKDNVIEIPRDFSTFNKRQHISLEEPFDGGGIPSEIFELVKVFVENFEANLRDEKIIAVLETKIEQQQRIKSRILEKLKDLTTKIETGEELPEKEQDYELLSEIDDQLE